MKIGRPSGLHTNLNNYFCHSVTNKSNRDILTQTQIFHNNGVFYSNKSDEIL